MTEISTSTTGITEQRCQYCGEIIIGKRADSIFCSAKCKQQDYKKRKKETGPRYMALIYVKSLENMDEATGERHRNQILEIVDKKSCKADTNNFVKFVTGFKKIEILLNVIERFYRYYQNDSVNLNDLKKIVADLNEIKNDFWQKAHFEFRIININMDFFMDFVKNKISELQMLGETEDKSDLPADFKLKLISFHAKISEKMEIEVS